jgi:TonB family protein
MNKQLILMLIFQLNVIGLVAQKDTIYFDNNGKITIKGFDTFYRVCDYDLVTKFPEKDFVDYYANSNNIYASGSYMGTKKSGVFTFYKYDNLKSNSISYNKEGYIDSIYVYQENGKDLRIKFSVLNSIFSILEWNDSTGKPLILEGKGQINYNNNLFSIFGIIKDNKPAGEWKIKTKEYILIESFRNGVFKTGKVEEYNGKKFETYTSNVLYLFSDFRHFENSEALLVSDYYRMADYPRLHKIFTLQWSLNIQSKNGFSTVESQPGFPGGFNNLSMYFQKKFLYPEDARKNNIKGDVIVSFTVDVDGQVKNPKIIKGLGYGCDEAAIELVKNMPDWIPGQQLGKPVPVIFKLPIRYE